jgi:hypothetical protein
MTLIRCPNNMMCNPGADYGPGANDSAGLQDCYVPPCNPTHDGAHMTGEGNQQAASDIAAFYSAQP